MSVHLDTGPARRMPCLQCRHDVLVALAEGLNVAVDITHLDPVAEITALAAGRRTYNLIRSGKRVELWHRDQWRMRTREYPVLPEHPCTLASLLAESPFKRPKPKQKLRSLDEAVNAQLQLPMTTDNSAPF